MYPVDSFQDHLTQFYHCVPSWLLSRPYDLNFTEKCCAFHWKPLCFSLKSNKNSWFKTQISHFDLVFRRVQREGQLDISYILVVFGGVCGACMCKWYTYTHILTWFCLFSWKVALFVWKVVHFSWKALKSTWKTTKTADSTQISYLDLVFHRVQRGRPTRYIIFWWYLVVHVCVNGTCIHTYWAGLVGFHEMWYFLHENQHSLWRAHEK